MCENCCFPPPTFSHFTPLSATLSGSGVCEWMKWILASGNFLIFNNSSEVSEQRAHFTISSCSSRYFSSFKLYMRCYIGWMCNRKPKVFSSNKMWIIVSRSNEFWLLFLAINGSYCAKMETLKIRSEQFSPRFSLSSSLCYSICCECAKLIHCRVESNGYQEWYFCQKKADERAKKMGSKCVSFLLLIY